MPNCNLERSIIIIIIIIILFAITVQHKIKDNIPRDGQGTTKSNTYCDP